MQQTKVQQIRVDHIVPHEERITSAKAKAILSKILSALITRTFWRCCENFAYYTPLLKCLQTKPETRSNGS